MELTVKPVLTIAELQAELGRHEKQWATSGQNGTYHVELSMAGGQVKSIRQSIETYSRPGEATTVPRKK